MRWVLSLTLATLLGLLAWGAASAQTAPEFKLGFAALADQIPDIVGEPLENEHHNPVNGDALQQTTKGLMVWRKADNWTAFTNGYMTWINGPYGVASRLNEQRFEWERDMVASQPSSPPPPATGLILYRADWSRGLDGWPEVAGWKVVDGTLVNDATTPNTSIMAPHAPETADYAVEAEIQVASSLWQRKAFGLVLRDGYLGGVNWYSYMIQHHPFVGTMTQVLVQSDFNIDNEWHKYRVEVRGGRLALLIDGVVRAEATDSRYSSPGRAGIWSNGVQINVRNFRIVAL